MSIYMKQIKIIQTTDMHITIIKQIIADLTVISSVLEYIKKLAPIMDDLEYKSREDGKQYIALYMI